MSATEKTTAMKNKDDLKILKDNFAIIRVSFEMSCIFP